MPLAALDATFDRRAAIGPQAHQLLRRAIISARLPLSENELAARLGVSRTPVREALGRLAEEGLSMSFPSTAPSLRRSGSTRCWRRGSSARRWNAR